MSTRSSRGSELTVSGIPLAPGVAEGALELVDPVRAESSNAATLDAEGEIARLRTSLEHVRRHLTDHVNDQLAPESEDFVQVVQAHVSILDDRHFFSSVEMRIRNDALSAEEAVRRCFSSAAARLQSSPSPIIRSRSEDLRDICQTVRRVLSYGPEVLAEPVDVLHRVQVVANLLPSVVLRARRQRAVALVAASRSTVSHGALMARASGIPTLIGVDLSAVELEPGAPALVDGDSGQLILWPNVNTLERYRRPRDTAAPVESSSAHGTALSASGERFTLWGNVNHPSQARDIVAHGLAGIGLFRTELLAMDFGRLPDAEEQYRAYSKVVAECRPRPVVFRTFDLGGDKALPTLDDCHGANPSLGVRGIRRHLLRQPQELEDQLQAILRAGHDAEVSVLLPMVTHPEEVTKVREAMHRVAERLRHGGTPYNPRVRLGAMLEVPAAAFAARELFRRVDFVSIGTNDLVQYLAAADRDNQAVLPYLDPDKAGLPAVLETIMQTARELGRVNDVYVCGDLASNPAWAARWIALGVRALSIVPRLAPRIRAAIALA